LQKEPVAVIIAEDACEAGVQAIEDPKSEGRGEIPCVNHMLHFSGIEIIYSLFQGDHVVMCISDYACNHGV
jgi:hypothetical protein